MLAKPCLILIAVLVTTPSAFGLRRAVTSPPGQQQVDKRAEKERQRREKEAAEQAEKARKQRGRAAKLKVDETIGDAVRADTVGKREWFVTRRYDRFKDITVTSVRPTQIDSYQVSYAAGFYTFSCWAFFETPGAAESRPASITLACRSLANGYVFGRESERNLILLVDGRRINVGTMEYDSPPSGGSEYLGARLPLSTFEQIAGAKLVEAQLGKYEFDLPAELLQQFLYLIGSPAVSNQGSSSNRN